jgi:hypothetical protein
MVRTRTLCVAAVANDVLLLDDKSPAAVQLVYDRAPLEHGMLLDGLVVE